MTMTNKWIKEEIERLGDYPPDCDSMTLREIFTDYDRSPENRVYWGCYDEDALDFVFHCDEAQYLKTN